jgi:hypothetical protein
VNDGERSLRSRTHGVHQAVFAVKPCVKSKNIKNAKNAKKKNEK